MYAATGPDFPFRSAPPRGLVSALSRTASYVASPRTTLAGLRCGLEAGREVRRVADRREASLLLGSDVADDRGAGVDPDSEARPVAVALRYSSGRLLEREACAGRPHRVIRLVRRCVEDDHDRVAGEALDHPAVM